MLAWMSNKELRKNIKHTFINGFRFMVSGVEQLTSNLNTNQCKHLKRFYKEDEFLKLIWRENVHQFDYIESWEKFEETKLPPKYVLYNKLDGKGIRNQNNQVAHKIWNRIDVNLTTAVLLFADVFETFWNTRLEKYKLDPAHFYTK